MRLLAVQGELEGQEFTVDAPVVILGRSKGADLVLPVRGVSRRHARLERVPQGWALTDLGSTNGTWINGRQIPANAAVLLRPGDRVDVASVGFLVQAAGPAGELPGEEQPRQRHRPAALPTSRARTPSSTPRMPSKLLIDLKQVVKVYETPAGPFTALKGVDLQVMAGEFVAVIGKSGSGKTTLINTITGIDRPSLGEVFVGGVPIHSLSEDQMARWRGQNLGIVFQFFQLLPTLTLIENVMLPMEFGRLYSHRQRKERAMHLLELVDIEDQAYSLPANVSGGQQQRAAIARALANDPLVLVADEPTGNLDSKTADAVFQLFEDLTDQGKTIMMVTHDQDLAARVGRVVQMVDGQIVDRRKAKAADTLSPQQLAQISSGLEPVTYPAGSLVYRQGDRADRFYIILNGQVEVVAEHPSAGQIIVGTLGRGQFFGGTGLPEGKPRAATVRTAAGAGAVLMALDRNTFSRLALDTRLSRDTIARLMRQGVTAEHLFTALPEQAQRHTLRIRASHERITYRPGEIIIREGDPADKFYLVTRGEVEVMQAGHGHQVAARLGSGQYFGGIGLLRGGRRTATVRAAADGETEVEVVALPREVYGELVAEPQMTKNEVTLIMRQRLGDEHA